MQAVYKSVPILPFAGSCHVLSAPAHGLRFIQGCGDKQGSRQSLINLCASLYIYMHSLGDHLGYGCLSNPLWLSHSSDLLDNPLVCSPIAWPNQCHNFTQLQSWLPSRSIVFSAMILVTELFMLCSSSSQCCPALMLLFCMVCSSPVELSDGAELGSFGVGDAICAKLKPHTPTAFI